MDNKTMTPVQLQVRRAQRRLFWQAWLTQLPTWGTALALLAGVWVVAQPFVLGPVIPWVRWSIMGGGLALGACLALFLAWRQTRSRLDAALALDDRFGLKERTTTALLLSETQRESPAGQALLEDVSEQLTRVNVRKRFPLMLNWWLVLVPLAVAAPLILTEYLRPAGQTANADTKDSDQLVAAKAEAIQKARDEVKKKLDLKKKQEPPVSQALKEMDLKMEQIFDEQVDPKSKEENRKQIQEIEKLEEKNAELMKQAQAALQQKAELEQKLQDLAKLDNPEVQKDGPAKELLEALNKGDKEKAEKELEKLKNKMADNKLSEEEQKKLADQLKEMQKQAEKLQQDRPDNDLKKLAEGLQACQACMKEGDGKKAGDKLGEAAKQLEQLQSQKAKAGQELAEANQKAQELKQLQQNQKMLQEARETICQNLGMGGGDPAGPRPGAKAGYGVKDAKQDAEIDPKGQFKAIGKGTIMSGTKTMIPSKDLPGVFQETAQEAQQAIERQPIAPEAAELLKGYYENLSGQKK